MQDRELSSESGTLDELRCTWKMAGVRAPLYSRLGLHDKKREKDEKESGLQLIAPQMGNKKDANEYFSTGSLTSSLFLILRGERGISGGQLLNVFIII